jgi:hypothetical protein
MYVFLFVKLIANLLYAISFLERPQNFGIFRLSSISVN